MEASLATPPLVPARMLNEYTYCPRLAYLEWVQGEWADNLDTEEGRFAAKIRNSRVLLRRNGQVPLRYSSP